MLWRLHVPVRSLPLPLHRTFKSHLSTAPAADALKILFCGSDHFSITSLRALVAAKRENPSLIDRIHVVHRPAKPTGRGLKELRQVPIQQAAEKELDLPTSAIDTFTGWTPPTPFDLIIAVSFGLKVPPRLLSAAKFGGLNVHPSLLPDLKGPAPIQHAILKRRRQIGVSVQTLHPDHFDHGVVLAQTPYPGVSYLPGSTAKGLEKILANEGAEMLLSVLKWRMYAPPLTDGGWYAGTTLPQDHAPKITKQDHFIDLERTSVQDIITQQLALGDLWCLLPDGQRVTVHQIRDTGVNDGSKGQPGIFAQDLTKYPILRDAYGHNALVMECTLAGGRRHEGGPVLLRKLPKLGSHEGPGWTGVSRRRDSSERMSYIDEDL
ncbi:hypothetical protein NX059_009113 [Plenodomus lindquistii]|nr:hypothetical protein NX059_009113 [Plenodomus lindquistii]